MKPISLLLKIRKLVGLRETKPMSLLHKPLLEDSHSSSLVKAVKEGIFEYLLIFWQIR